MSSEMWGVVVGGLIGVISTLVALFAGERRNRSEWRRQAQLEAAKTALLAMQSLNREITNIAISPTQVIDGVEERWPLLHQATVQWNGARYGSLLVSPPTEIILLNRIDVELDRLLDAAVSKAWAAKEFRLERMPLGELGSKYVQTVRRSAKEGEVAISSLWTWDEQSA